VSRRALALLGAIVLDLTLGEPPNRLHPVVGIGRALSVGHDRFRRAPRKLQLAGGAATVGTVTLGAALIGRKLERHPRRTLGQHEPLKTKTPNMRRRKAPRCYSAVIWGR